jgi:hypothetical protein
MKAKKNFTTGLMKGVGANVVILGRVLSVIAVALFMRFVKEKD